MAIYLIDFENVGTLGFKGVENITSNDMIIIFYSNYSHTITLEILQSITEKKAEIQYRKVSTGTKNALDFQLVSYMGYLIGTTPQQNEFYIVSKDNGFSVLVDFWKDKSITVRTVHNLAGETVAEGVPVPPVPPPSTSEQKAIELVKSIISDVVQDDDLTEQVFDILVTNTSKTRANAELCVLLKDGQKISELFKRTKPYITFETG